MSDYSEINLGRLHDEAEGINKLFDKGLLTAEVINILDSETLTELANRSSDLIAKLKNDPEDIYEKIRYLSGEGDLRISRLELTIRSLLAATLINVKYGETFDGVIFYGSRNRLCINRPGGDQDVFFIASDEDFSEDSLPLNFENFNERVLRKLLGRPLEIHYLTERDINNLSPADLPEICKGSIPIIWNPKIRRTFIDKFKDQLNKPQNFEKKSIIANVKL